ncbi:MAG: hypothetical protein ACI8VW_001544 [bacterium]|jgi:uncharacterized protein (DUF697 family)
MKLQPGWRRWLQELITPVSSPALEELLLQHRKALPALWLLGKAGAGKSSIVQRLTGDTRATIGNGFAPCTKTAMYYDHPASSSLTSSPTGLPTGLPTGDPVGPVMRFLDTRGLGEANYNPADDLAEASSGSHALLLLTRVDDTSQAELLRALKSVSGKLSNMALLHVHTALHTVPADELPRAIEYNKNLIADALDRIPPNVHIDFTDPDDGFEDSDRGLTELRTAIIELVPELNRILTQFEAKDKEESLFLTHNREILGYAAAAAAADVFPAIGLFAVPTIQGKLLHTLAGRYNITWDKRIAMEFVAAMGSSFLYRYALSLGGRQLAKFIPVYGQTAGAAAASALSFASTYAIARAACMYLYHQKIHKPVSSEALQEAFKRAFNDQKKS